MYKYVLLVTMGQYEKAMLINTPDLLKALEEFEKSRYIDDKNSMLLNITGARIIPITFEEK